MKIIKECNRVIVFDSQTVIHPKTKQPLKVLNKTDNLEIILKDSPIVDKNDTKTCIGVIKDTSNRSRTSLYYGDIILNDDSYNKFEIIGHNFNYDKLTDTEINITGVTTIIEKID